MTWQETVSVGIAFVTAVLYTGMGIALGRRTLAARNLPALRAFRTWWFAIAAASLATPLLLFLFNRGLLEAWVYPWIQQIVYLLYCVALWGLLCYLLYLFRGHTKGWMGIAVFYGLVYCGLLAISGIYMSTPEFQSNGWTVRPVPAPALPLWATLLLLIALLAPPMAACVAYFLLAKYTTDATSKYRIRVVSVSILVWFSVSFGAALVPDRSDALHVATRLIGLAGASALVLAYFPPRAWQRRYGLRRLGDEGTGTGAAAPTS